MVLRKTVSVLILSCSIALFASATRAEEPSSGGQLPPEQLLLDKVNQILDIVRLPDYKAPEKRAEYRAQIKAILLQMMDMRTISMLVLADKRKAFNDDQFDEFIDSLTRILFLSYVGHLDDYTDQQVEVESTEEVKESKIPRVRVRTQTTSRLKGTKIPVEYSMTLVEDAWAVYDVRVEGLSFVANYRSQFRELLHSRKPEQLLKMMKDKADKLEKDNIQVNVDDKLF